MVDHVTVYRWVQRFSPLPADAARHSPGDRWFVDETYVRVNAVWRYVYRAIDSTARSSTCWSGPAGTRQPLAGSSQVRSGR